MTKQEPSSPLEEFFGESIYSYTLKQALDDGVLESMILDLDPAMLEMVKGKVLVMTVGVAYELTAEERQTVWELYCHWREHTLPTLAAEEQLFSTSIRKYKVFVIEDGVAFTAMLSSEY
jgi:hypothetical protein